MTALREVKTDEYTIESGHLDVGDGHKVYFEQWGNKEAKTPIIFFHGGPGSGYKAKHKVPFDPKRHQVIFFDQRGISNSLPHGKLEHNTTQNLIDDAVKILEHLNIKKVFAYGGSWGAAMALLFTIEQASRVAATIVNGVFTASTAETEYLFEGRAKQFYPEVWERLVKSTPLKHTNNPYAYHAQILVTIKKPKKLIASAEALQEYDLPVLGFDWRDYPSFIKESDQPDEEYDYVPYKILAHYLLNDYFLPQDHILHNAAAIKTPLYIVQGRYDMACLPITAYKIHKAVKHSKLFMTLGSHSASDPQNRTALKALIETVFV